MKIFSVDRIEAEIAVLIDEEQRAYEVACSDLPEGIKEGALISYDEKRYKIEPDETAAKKAEVRSLIRDLFR